MTPGTTNVHRQPVSGFVAGTMDHIAAAVNQPAEPQEILQVLMRNEWEAIDELGFECFQACNFFGDDVAQLIGFGNGSSFITLWTRLVVPRKIGDLR